MVRCPVSLRKLRNLQYWFVCVIIRCVCVCLCVCVSLQGEGYACTKPHLQAYGLLTASINNHNHDVYSQFKFVYFTLFITYFRLTLKMLKDLVRYVIQLPYMLPSAGDSNFEAFVANYKCWQSIQLCSQHQEFSASKLQAL